MLAFLVKLSRFFTSFTPVIAIVVSIAALFCPQLFLWVHGTAATIILALVMLTMGMTLSKEDFKILAMRPFDIAIGTLAQFIIMPLVAWSLAKIFGLSNELAIGLMLVGCCPGGVSSNIMSFLCKGDVAFSVGMTTVSTLLAPIMTPLLMLFLAGERVDIDAVGMFKSVLLVTLAPVVLGAIFNRFLGECRAYCETMKVMPTIAVICFALIVGGVAARHGAKMISSGLFIFTAVFCHNAIGYVLGFIVGIFARFNKAKRRTISIEVGMQNAGLATVLATRHFVSSPEVAIACAISCVWHSISGALLADIFNRLDAFLTRRKK